jgi:hypothetical protein
MAQVQFGDILEVNFTNSLRAVDGNGGSGDQLTDPSDYSNITNLDAFLNAYDEFTYSTEQLQIMNVNDKIFAVRSIQDSTTIADYVTAQTARTA